MRIPFLVLKIILSSRWHPLYACRRVVLSKASHAFQKGRACGHLSMWSMSSSLCLHPRRHAWSGFRGWRFLASHARWRRRCQFFSSVASESGVRRDSQMLSQARVGISRVVKRSRHAASQWGRWSSFFAFAINRLVRMEVISCIVREERVLGDPFGLRGGWPSACDFGFEFPE